MWRYAVRGSLTVICLLAVCASVYAQGAIAGAVKDSTGAVLPGVTVEASSPALIEKSRIAVTDGRGHYSIADLRPGVYTATFTLSGFRTFKREGIELTGAFTAEVDVSLAVGDMAETVTVTGASPVVDVRGALQETVLTRKVLDAIPTGRNLWGQATLIPGVQPVRFDVGGVEGMFEHRAYVNGSDGDEVFSFDGMMVNSSLGEGGSIGIYVHDGLFEEIGLQTSTLPAEVATGGINYNLVMRSGGNEFRGSGYLSWAGEGWQANNLSDDLRRRGLNVTNNVSKIFDISFMFGGPLRRDKLWFITTADLRGLDQYAGGVLNPDGSKALEDSRIKDYMARLTLQVTPRNKIGAWFERNDKSVGERRDTTSEYQFIESRASYYQRSPVGYTTGVKWTSTISNRLMLDSGAVIRFLNSDRGPQADADDFVRIDFIRSTLTGSAPNKLNSITGNYRFTSSISYVTGSHSLKSGIQYGKGFNEAWRIVPQGVHLRFRDGVADSVDLWNTPVYPRNNVDLELGVYAQDRWTIGQLTLSPGVRMDRLVVNVPAQTAPAGPWVGQRAFGEIRNVPNWTTVSPRFAAAYDVFGTGKTAIKGGASRYVASEAVTLASAVNPVIAGRDRRAWVDRNGDALPQTDELGPSTGFTGGVTTRIDPAIERPYNWEFTVGVDHELMPGFGVSATYHRRQHRNMLGTRNAAVTRADYSPVTITNRLTGEPLTVFNQSSATRGLRDTVFSNQKELDSAYDGVEFQATRRFQSGNQLAGGVTIGRRDSNLGGDLNNPNNLINFRGAHAQDSTVQLKVRGIYALPWGVQLSGFFQSMTGYPLRRTLTVTRADVPNLTQVTQTVDLVPRGEVRLPRVNLFDVRLAKRFSWGKRAVESLVDVYNILNANATISEVETVGSALGRPVRILPGRLLRVGFRVTF